MAGWQDTYAGGSDTSNDPGSSGPSFASNRTYGYTAEEASIPILVGRGQHGFNIGGDTGDVDRGYTETPDQNATLAQIMDGFSTADPQTLIDTQKKLYLGGFYKLGKGELPKFGQVNEDDLAAMGRAVRETARRKTLTLDEVIDSHVNSEQSGGTQRTQRKYTNPDDIKVGVKAAAQKVLGNRGDDGLANAIASKYHGLEDQAYAQQDADQDVTAPPSADQAWLEEQIRQLRPETSHAFQTSGNIGTFLKMVDPQGLFSAYHQ